MRDGAKPRSGHSLAWIGGLGQIGLGVDVRSSRADAQHKTSGIGEWRRLGQRCQVDNGDSITLRSGNRD